MQCKFCLVLLQQKLFTENLYTQTSPYRLLKSNNINPFNDFWELPLIFFFFSPFISWRWLSLINLYSWKFLLVLITFLNSKLLKHIPCSIWISCIHMFPLHGYLEKMLLMAKMGDLCEFVTTEHSAVGMIGKKWMHKCTPIDNQCSSFISSCIHEKPL